MSEAIVPCDIHSVNTLISNEATETAQGIHNPALFTSNPDFAFQCLPAVQRAFFVGCTGSVNYRG